jgi:hypothetical protein
LRIVTIDSAGNKNDDESTYFHVVIDSNAPNPPSILTPSQNAITDHSTLSITGTAEAFSRVRLFEGASGPASSLALAETTADSTGFFQMPPLISLGLGPRAIRAFARDASGNESSASAPRFFTLLSYCPQNNGKECSGAGSCIIGNQAQEYYCQCQDGFFGEKCQFQAQACAVQSGDYLAKNSEWSAISPWMTSQIPKNEDPFVLADGKWSKSAKTNAVASSNPNEWSRLSSLRWCLGYEGGKQMLQLGAGASRMPNSYKSLADNKNYLFGSGPALEAVSPQSQSFRTVWKIGVKRTGKVYYISATEHIPGQDGKVPQWQVLHEVYKESDLVSLDDESAFAKLRISSDDDFLYGQGGFEKNAPSGLSAQELSIPERSVELVPFIEILGLQSISDDILVQVQSYSLVYSQNNTQMNELLRDSSGVLSMKGFSSSQTLTAPKLRYTKKRQVLRCMPPSGQRQGVKKFIFQKVGISPDGKETYRIVKKKTGVLSLRLKNHESVTCAVQYNSSQSASARIMTAP